MSNNTSIVENIYASFATGDMPAVLAAFSADISWTEAEGFPYAGTYKATGKSFKAPFVDVWKLVDGKVVFFKMLTDTAIVQAVLK